MAAFDLDTYLARSGAVDLWAVDWAGVPKHPLPPGAIRTLRYMQDIESHTIVYLRSLLATRAIDDPDVATFLACWVHEETFHGLALERFLAAAGHPMGPRPKPHGHESFPQWLEARSTAMLWRFENSPAPRPGRPTAPTTSIDARSMTAMCSWAASAMYSHRSSGDTTTPNVEPVPCESRWL